MMDTTLDKGFETPVIRYFVDIRPYVPPIGSSQNRTSQGDRRDLPLLQFLPQDVQEAVGRYLRPPDRFMSLASALLKMLFIHRTAKIPWSHVKVSRTPKPHSRPYWEPPPDWHGDGFDGLEFNVSHQAGMVILVGCKSPNRPKDARLTQSTVSDTQLQTTINPDPTVISQFESEIEHADHKSTEVRLGVDIACTWEPPRSPDLSTQPKFDEWVDIFGEMFSDRERTDMKDAAVMRGTTNQMGQKVRRFYTYWSLKEAYIKMVGEGLLADWLKQLEFVDVVSPARPDSRTREKWAKEKDVIEAGLRILFKGKDITNTMLTSLESFEDIFIIATMMRGVNESKTSGGAWLPIDFEKDIRPCAEGKCSCLL